MLREMAEAAEGFTLTRGLVVVLEDLHWSDVSTLDWVTYMARRREPAKLLIIGTYRPADVLASGHLLRGVVQELQARQQCEELRLAPLAKEAIAAYKQRLTELQAELEEAQEFHDLGRVNRLQEEIEFLTRELSQAIGLGGRVRKAASTSERARLNVTRAIHRALDRIAETHPRLGQYLARTIKTGNICVYTPDPHQPVTWEF